MIGLVLALLVGIGIGTAVGLGVARRRADAAEPARPTEAAGAPSADTVAVASGTAAPGR